MSGLSLLSHPAIYNVTQWLVGAERPRRYCVERYGAVHAGARVIDVGCGPGLAVRYLPPVDYVGFEPNPRYIDSARRRFNERGRFVCGYFDAQAAQRLAPYDLVLLLGVLHHCDDRTAQQLFADIASGLAPNGRVVTLDPCFVPAQSRLARYVARADRGRYVRSPEDYRRIGCSALQTFASETRDGFLLIPTTVHIASFGRPVTDGASV